jgi:hypothetical protein
MLLTFSLCGIIAIALMLFVKVAMCKYIIYATWLLVGFFTFFGFLVSSFLVVGTIVTSEACWVLNQTINNQSAYKEYMTALFDESN